MKKTIIFLITIGLFYSCVNNTKNEPEINNSEQESKRYMRTLLMTPDSLRSPEDKALLKKIDAVFYENYIIENNRLALHISKEEWIKKGIKKEFYDLMKKEIEDINNWIDTTSFQKQLFWDSFQNAKEEYYKERGKSPS